MVGCVFFFGVVVFVLVFVLFVVRFEVDFLWVDGSVVVFVGVVVEGEGVYFGGRSDGLVCKLGEGDEVRWRK